MDEENFQRLLRRYNGKLWWYVNLRADWSPDITSTIIIDQENGRWSIQTWRADCCTKHAREINRQLEEEHHWYIQRYRATNWHRNRSSLCWFAGRNLEFENQQLPTIQKTKRLVAVCAHVIHPSPQILKQLPASIADRLSKNSSSGTIFNQSKPEYEEALKKSGYHNVNLQYAEHPEEEIEIAISSGLIRRTQKMFPRMLQRNFCPLFRSTSRVNTWESSSTRTTCTDNMRTIISRHNSKLSRPKKQPSSECNCRKKEDCPLNGTCKQSSVVYKCDVSAPNHPDKVYIGLTEKDFKTRKLSINNAKYKNSTSLSTYVWELKDI